MDLLFQSVCACVRVRACIKGPSTSGGSLHHTASPHSCSFSSQFDSEFQFDSSVKTLLSRLPKQRYLKSICDELHDFKIIKKYVASLSRSFWVGLRGKCLNMRVVVGVTSPFLPQHSFF